MKVDAAPVICALSSLRAARKTSLLASGLGRYGSTLTVLTCAIRDESDENDDEDEDKLIEGWTPRFHKR